MVKAASITQWRALTILIAVTTSVPLIAGGAGLVVIGGMARLAGLAVGAPPSWPHLAALGVELGIAPGALLWRARLRRNAAAPP